MRFLSISVLFVLGSATGYGQPAAKDTPTAKDLITKYRTAIGADGPKTPKPYVIKYRGQRFLYSLTDGKLKGLIFDFDSSLTGQTDKPQMIRAETEMKIGIVPFRMIEVVDGEAGWYQINDSPPVAMSKTLIGARRQRDIDINIFLGLESFDPEHWQYSEPKGARIRGQEVWMIEVKTKGLEPISLAFSKQSGLLVHLRSKAKDFEVLPGEQPKIETFTRDIYFFNWKKFENRMLPGNFDIFRDSILWKQMEPVSVTLPKTLDANLFVMPRTEK